MSRAYLVDTSQSTIIGHCSDYRKWCTSPGDSNWDLSTQNGARHIIVYSDHSSVFSWSRPSLRRLIQLRPQRPLWRLHRSTQSSLSWFGLQQLLGDPLVAGLPSKTAGNTGIRPNNNRSRRDRLYRIPRTRTCGCRRSDPMDHIEYLHSIVPGWWLRDCILQSLCWKHKTKSCHGDGEIHSFSKYLQSHAGLLVSWLRCEFMWHGWEWRHCLSIQRQLCHGRNVVSQQYRNHNHWIIQSDWKDRRRIQSDIDSLCGEQWRLSMQWIVRSNDSYHRDIDFLWHGIGAVDHNVHRVYTKETEDRQEGAIWPGGGGIGYRITAEMI